MIQRIQTIYLLLTAAVAAVASVMPLTYFSISSGELFDLYASGVRAVGGEQIQGSIYMLILSVAAAVLPIVTIFLFKNRMLQVRLCTMEFVLLFGNYAMIGAYYYLSHRAFEQVGIVAKGFHPAIFAPST